MKFSCSVCGAEQELGDAGIGSSRDQVRCERCGSPIVNSSSEWVAGIEDESRRPQSGHHEAPPFPAETDWVLGLGTPRSGSQAVDGGYEVSSRPNPLAGSPERLSALADLAAETETESGTDPGRGASAADGLVTESLHESTSRGGSAIRVTPFPADAERPTATVSVARPPDDDLMTTGPLTDRLPVPAPASPAPMPANGAAAALDLLSEAAGPTSRPHLHPTTDEAAALFEEPTVGFEVPPSDRAHGAEEGVEEEIGTAFAAMFDGASRVPATLEEAPEEPPRMESGPQLEMAAPIEVATPMPLSSSRAEWFLAIEDEQVGPLTMEEVAERWAVGDVGPSSLCWRRGMGEWTAIETVNDLDDLRASTPSQRPTSQAFGPSTFALTGEMAPSIALEPEVEGVEEPPATDDGAWRPNAASALASLAAEELGESKSAAEPAPRGRPTVAKMTALPTVNNELSRLLEGSGRAEGTASMFGLAEKSVSKVRAIPRKAETVVPAPRSPASAVERPWLRYLVMAGAAVFLLLAGAVGAYAFFGGESRRAPPAPTVASIPGPTTATPQPQATGSAPSETPRLQAEEGPSPQAPAPAPGLPAAPATVLAAATEGTMAPSSSANPAPVALAAALGGASAPPGAPSAAAPTTPGVASRIASAPPAGAASKSETTRRAVKTKKVSRRSKKRRRGSTSRSRRTTARRTPRTRAPVSRSAPSPEEDLLAAAGTGRVRSSPRRAPAAPKLDETEVFRVLRKHKTQVRECIDRHARSGGPSGRVRVTITISPAGRVTRSSFTPAEFQNAVLGRCLASNARTWRFPAFTGKPTPVGFPVVVKD